MRVWCQLVTLLATFTILVASPVAALPFCAKCQTYEREFGGQFSICVAATRIGGEECVINPDESCHTIGRCLIQWA